MSELRPIRLVLTEDRDLSRVPSGGGPRKVFKDVDSRFRGRIAGELDSIAGRYSQVLKKQKLPVVAKVVLEQEALAKSHRPDSLFSVQTCPIIGCDTIGTLLLSVTDEGLHRLKKQVLNGTTIDVEADLSTVVEIGSFDPIIDVVKESERQTVLKPLKIKLFNHIDSKQNQRIYAAFMERLTGFNIQQITYSSEMIVFRIDDPTSDLINELRGFVGTQSLSFLPTISLAGQYLPAGTLSEVRFPPPLQGHEYPVVGLIDSGTDPTNERLQEWVIKRDDEDVAASDQDNRHGSFVAGLIANSRALNASDNFPDVQAMIVDIVAVPKNSPLYESDLLKTIRRAVAENRDVRVWNLSISNEGVTCDDNQISDFAMALDEIQTINDVLLVNCTGNLKTLPLRKWPSTPTSERDRILAPADSVRALSVGSIAHLKNNQTLVRVGEPSPFSRRGPGTAFMPKPEICHYGGNCDSSMNYAQVGVMSTTENLGLVESIGTSFSTPLIASLAAGALSATEGNQLSINMTKALIVHSAALKSRTTKASDLRYRGFGVPGSLKELLECETWRATLLFEPEIPVDRRIFSKLDFPIPKCFRQADGKLKGGILLTAVYDPPLSSTGGYDYCQANVEISLGSYDSKNPEEDPAHSRIVPFHPKDYSKLGEKNLVEHGFKWSPVKVFQHEFREKAADRIRLYVRLYLRENQIPVDSQNVAIVASLYDPSRSLPVYNQTIQELNATGWQTQIIAVKEQVRSRLK